MEREKAVEKEGVTEEGRKREGGCEGVGKPASEREKVREKGGGRKSESASERTKEKEREREISSYRCASRAYASVVCATEDSDRTGMRLFFCLLLHFLCFLW